MLPVPNFLKAATSIDQLIRFVYGDVESLRPEDAIRRAILTPSNECRRELNNTILLRVPGNTVHALASDTFMLDGTDAGSARRRPTVTAATNAAAHRPARPQASPVEYPPEVLNVINVPGVPEGNLVLKQGCIVMFLRNLNFAQGIVNGAKGIVRRISRYRLVVELLNKDNTMVSVPRITFNVHVGRKGLTFQRLQFPVTVAYAMTIHKSQGQTLDRVGIDLRTPLFDHGMLYVALSRARSEDDILLLHAPRFYVGSQPFYHNVVYKSLLQHAI